MSRFRIVWAHPTCLSFWHDPPHKQIKLNVIFSQHAVYKYFGSTEFLSLLSKKPQVSTENECFFFWQKIRKISVYFG